MNNLVICVGDFDKFEKDFVGKSILNNMIKSAKKVHLYHCFEITFYNNEFSQYSWPDQKDFPEIEKAVKSKLNECASKLGLKSDEVEISCSIESDAKEAVKHYLKDIKAEACVVATKQVGSVSEIFQSSFTDYLTRFAPCDTLVLK